MPQILKKRMGLKKALNFQRNIICIVSITAVASTVFESVRGSATAQWLERVKLPALRGGSFTKKLFMSMNQFSNIKFYQDFSEICLKKE